MNKHKGEPFSNERLRQAVIYVREETDAEHERSINDITCDGSYHSPTKKKDVSTINDSVYYELDEHVDTISDSIKQVDARNDPIKDTYIVNRVRNLSVGVVSVETAVIGVVIIGQGITQCVIKGGTNIGRNLVTNV